MSESSVGDAGKAESIASIRLKASYSRLSTWRKFVEFGGGQPVRTRCQVASSPSTAPSSCLLVASNGQEGPQHGCRADCSHAGNLARLSPATQLPLPGLDSPQLGACGRSDGRGTEEKRTETPTAVGRGGRGGRRRGGGLNTRSTDEGQGRRGRDERGPEGWRGNVSTSQAGSKPYRRSSARCAACCSGDEAGCEEGDGSHVRSLFPSIFKISTKLIESSQGSRCQADSLSGLRDCPRPGCYLDCSRQACVLVILLVLQQLTLPLCSIRTARSSRRPYLPLLPSPKTPTCFPSSRLLRARGNARRSSEEERSRTERGAPSTATSLLRARGACSRPRECGCEARVILASLSLARHVVVQISILQQC